EELVPLRIEQQDGGAFRVQGLAALAHHDCQQLVELETRGEGAGELVQQAKPSLAPGAGHGTPVSLASRGKSMAEAAQSSTPSMPTTNTAQRPMRTCDRATPRSVPWRR